MKKKLQQLLSITTAGIVLLITPNSPVMTDNDTTATDTHTSKENAVSALEMAAVTIPTITYDDTSTMIKENDMKIIVDTTNLKNTDNNNDSDSNESTNNDTNDSDLTTVQKDTVNVDESDSSENNVENKATDESSNTSSDSETRENTDSTKSTSVSQDDNSSSDDSNANTDTTVNDNEKTESAKPSTSSSTSSSSKSPITTSSSKSSNISKTVKKKSTSSTKSSQNSSNSKTSVKHYSNMKTIKAGDDSSTIVKLSSNGSGTIPLVITRNSKSAAKNSPVYVSVLCSTGNLYSGAYNVKLGETVVKNIPFTKDCTIKARTDYPTSKWNGTYTAVNISYGKPSTRSGQSYSEKAQWKTKPVVKTKDFSINAKKGLTGSMVVKLTGCSTPGGSTDKTITNGCDGYIQKKIASGGKIELIDNGKVIKAQNFNISSDKHHETFTIPFSNLHSNNLKIRITRSSGPAVLVHGPGSSIVGSY